MKLNYYKSCVDFDRRDVDWLLFVIDKAREITLKTFRKHVSPEDFRALQQQLGYTTSRRSKQPRLRMANDYYVSYHRSKAPDGKPAYYVQHSRIEHIFTV